MGQIKNIKLHIVTDIKNLKELAVGWRMEYNSGLENLKKPSTKVVAPPGGRTNINIFGGEEPAIQKPVNEGQKKRNTSHIFDAPAANENKNCSVNNTNNNKNKNTNNEKPAVKTNENESAAPPVEGAKAPGGGRASTKVMAPPGGKTSISSVKKLCIGCVRWKVICA